MIKYGLNCSNGHEFEAWFRSADDFDQQKSRKLVTCPACGSPEVDKALMAPAVSTGRKKQQIALALGEEQKKAMEQLKALARQVRENAEYVGPQFAEEARKIHFGEAETRGIYGEATIDEARSLAEDGIEFLPLPILPEDTN
ncbi:hypothetical protein GCM10011385_15420 [Nitratireductor aestuarii]|uniref:DUF1178 family protein n=1 Tax=Nitratireductor aestuarii TaxID=1735103 RepID=A0A916RNA8_9HYPH|nr:DUF1178 family protein [Nitratireductor aestuarii]GGA62546.1 hypothetical protein GCM10011385_15420 [Nitratireductor aestuarii]